MQTQTSYWTNQLSITPPCSTATTTRKQINVPRRFIHISWTLHQTSLSCRLLVSTTHSNSQKKDNKTAENVTLNILNRKQAKWSPQASVPTREVTVFVCLIINIAICMYACIQIHKHTCMQTIMHIYTHTCNHAEVVSDFRDFDHSMRLDAHRLDSWFFPPIIFNCPVFITQPCDSPWKPHILVLGWEKTWCCLCKCSTSTSRFDDAHHCCKVWLITRSLMPAWTNVANVRLCFGFYTILCKI